MIRISIALLCICHWVMALGQQRISQEIHGLLAQGNRFHEVSLFRFLSSNVEDRSFHLEGLSSGTIMEIDQEAIEKLKKGENDFIQLQLPVSDRSELKITLVRHEIFAEDFALYTSSNPGAPVDYVPGIHYKGIVEGDDNAIAAVSIFNDEVMGLITTEHGNIVLGRIQNDRENRHVLYNDADLVRKHDFECETVDNGIGYTEEDLQPQISGRDVGDCVRVYIEIDDDIVTDKGGATPATNYITGLFNQSIVLYTAEVVNMTISQIYAWTTNSPYTGSSSSAMLTSFQANTGEFNGNVGHLVSYQASGGIAVLDNLCSSNPDWRKCFSSIDATYATVPTYSWSVMVITHEMGHVIGSKHTHACAWNGNNTAIDGCAGAVEGNCPLPPIPPGGGTIMSYCHITSAGINFSLGFGTQPGNVIRNRVNAAGNCLTSCGPPPPPPPPAYCASNGSNSNYEWINKVVLGSINNTSGNNSGYGNYTSLSTNLTAGTSYTINLTPGFASGSYLEYWRVWIDYNGDLDWNDSGEQVGQGSGSSAINVAFTVPGGTSSGSKRMRVSMQFNAYPPICGTFTFGEVEDYTVIIGAGSGPTCTDGIQNQGETGIDCGGPCPACPPPPPPPPGGETIILQSYFETGWDTWVDNGSDAARVNTSNSWEGNYSIRLADNSGTNSAMTTPAFNLSTATGLEIEFYFKAISMEAGEDFWIQYKSGSGAWTTIGQFIRGTHFNNNAFYVTSLMVPGFVPTSSGKLRIQCDAGDDTDQIYIDQVTVTKMTGAGLIEANMSIKEVKEFPGSNISDHSLEDTAQPVVYPNPAKEALHISYDGEIKSLRLLSLDGVEYKVQDEVRTEKFMDIHDLMPGIYLLMIQSGDQWYPVKFNKM